MVPIVPLPCRKPNRRIRVSLRVEHWPADDRQAWHALFTTGDLFDEKGPGAHLAPRTRTSIENVYGPRLGFFAHTEPHGLEEATGTRVTPERVIAFAQQIAQKNKPSTDRKSVV